MMPRHVNVPVVAVLCRRGGRVLLLHRSNTTRSDGQWGPVAGHVDAGESYRAAALREVREEIGVEIDPSAFRCVHACHTKEGDGRESVIVYFVVDEGGWTGEPHVAEPHKCDDLQWYTTDALPAQTIPHVRAVIKAIDAGQAYSERGRYQETPVYDYAVCGRHTVVPGVCVLVCRPQAHTQSISSSNNQVPQRLPTREIVLLHRHHTGRGDGTRAPVAGHGEPCETLTLTATREATEEIGIEAVVETGSFVHIHSRRSSDGREGVYLYFVVDAGGWTGEPHNAEPEKCAGLQWAAIDTLPAQTSGHIRTMIDAIARG